jgi:hypothetical protein
MPYRRRFRTQSMPGSSLYASLGGICPWSYGRNGRESSWPVKAGAASLFRLTPFQPGGKRPQYTVQKRYGAHRNAGKNCSEMRRGQKLIPFLVALLVPDFGSPMPGWHAPGADDLGGKLIVQLGTPHRTKCAHVAYEDRIMNRNGSDRAAAHDAFAFTTLFQKPQTCAREPAALHVIVMLLRTKTPVF